MKAVIQRVQNAKVEVEGQTIGEVGRGLLIFLGVANGDTRDHVTKIIQKISKLRIFEDADGKMNLSVLEVGGSLLVVSQFTLMADTSLGNRPSFKEAARPEVAKPLYEFAIEESKRLGIPTEGGQFQSDMKVSLVNDGPVTLVIEI
jgi:D-tyrosyl-tRNA(Tyr) deacylase